MDIKVIITVDREEIEEYREEYLECNDDNPTDNEILEEFRERFYTDCRDYIIGFAEIKMMIRG